MPACRIIKSFLMTYLRGTKYENGVTGSRFSLWLGVIVTRCSELQEIFESPNKGDSYGNSITHMAKLIPRLEGGSGGGCPFAVFGIKRGAYVSDQAGA